MQTNPRNTAFRITTKIWAYYLIFLCLNAISPENFANFSMMFNMFVNMFWRAESFGYMLGPLVFNYFRNMCLVFSLELQKNYLSGEKKRKTEFWLSA